MKNQEGIKVINKQIENIDNQGENGIDCPRIYLSQNNDDPLDDQEENYINPHDTADKAKDSISDAKKRDCMKPSNKLRKIYSCLKKNDFLDISNPGSKI